jgi:hypothetical protein
VLFSRRQFRSDSKELCVANGGYQYRVGHGVSCDMPGVCLKSRSIVVPGVPSDIADRGGDPNRTYWCSPPKRRLDLDWQM